MDAIEMLTNDHNKVRELFKTFKGGRRITGLLRRTVGEVTGAARRRAVEQVCTELDVHTLIEEEIFYPAVRALGDRGLIKQVNEALKEHSRVKAEVASLREKHDDVDGLEQRMSQLEEDVEHHATEEEDEMFPRLEEVMPDDERRELARWMHALKERAASSASAGTRGVAAGEQVASR